MMKKLRKTIFNKKKTGDNGQNILLYSGNGMVVIGFLAIFYLFFWPPVFFEKLVENQTLKDASLIITPLTGILSAVIIFLSFVFQQLSTTKQLELQRLEKGMEFIYYRLTELQGYSTQTEFRNYLIDINSLLHLLIHPIQIENKPFPGYKEKVKEKISDNKEALSFLVKYLNIIIIIKTKLNEIDKKFGIDYNQKGYIKSALEYEFQLMIEKKTANLKSFKSKIYIEKGIIEKETVLIEIESLYDQAKSLISK